MSDQATSELYIPLLLYAMYANKPDDPDWFRQIVGPRGRLGDLSAASFLLHRTGVDGAPCVHNFIFHFAPVLLHQLSRTTEPQRVILHGRVRGKVDWSATYKARYSEDANPTVFVCQQSWRRFDRPENQLFKFLLHTIQSCLIRVSSPLREWRAWGPALCTSQGEPLFIADYLATIAHRVRHFTTHAYLREVNLPENISGRHLLAARTSKTELYSKLAGLYKLYNNVVAVPDWSEWASILSHTLPLPREAEEVGRMLILSRI
jgi:hypothetical protein